MNKKAQAGFELSEFIAKGAFYGLVAFGLIQFFGFIFPAFGTFILDLSTKYFGGTKIILLMIVGGLLGFVINEGAQLLQLRQFPVSGRMVAAFGAALGVVILSFVFTYLGSTGVVSANVINAMIL